MSFIDRIREANTHDLSGFTPFHVSGLQVGFVTSRFTKILAGWPNVFRVEAGSVTLQDGLNHPETPVGVRSAAVHEVLLRLRDEGVIAGWRDEMYPVSRSFGEPPCLLMERAAVPFFGVCAYGVHMNGFVRDGAKLKLWVARRSLTKPTGPGKLDQLAAGGQPAGIGIRANMIKECREEAGVPAALAERIVPVGALTYCLEVPQGLRPDVIFNFDLALPGDFRPVNMDGEVAEFYLWPIDKVIETVRDTNEFKFNCALVVIDFLIRHGLIEADHPDYLALVRGLRYPAAARGGVNG